MTSPVVGITREDAATAWFYDMIKPGRADIASRAPADAALSAKQGNELRQNNVLTGVTAEFSEEALARAASLSEEAPAKTADTEDELSREEQQELRRLQQRDAEVKQHEQAHVAAGGQYVRGKANYEYQRGPDGRQYAVGGDVSIDVGPEGNPEATLRKMQVVRRAALAPANPSPQDRNVAAQASQNEQKARMELARQKQEAVDKPDDKETSDAVAPEETGAPVAEGTEVGVGMDASRIPNMVAG